MVLRMRSSDAHLVLHPMAWRVVASVASAGIGMLLGAVIGALAFGRGTVGAEFSVVATVLATTVLSGVAMRQSNAFTAQGFPRVPDSADHRGSSSRCDR